MTALLIWSSFLFLFWGFLHTRKEPDNQAFPVIEATLKEICGLRAFYPQVGLSLLTTLTNQISVRFVQQFLYTPDSHHSLNKPDVQQIVSTRLALHHMCKALLRRYPMLQRFVDDSVEVFKRDQQYRNKSATHNMGEFWILLQLSSAFNWDDLKEEIMDEVFTRGTRWMLKGCPALEYGVHNEAGGQEYVQERQDQQPISGGQSPLRQRDVLPQVSLCFRLTKAFEQKRTSFCLMLFTVVIMDSVQRHNLDGGGTEGTQADITTTLRRPSEAQVTETAAELDRILRVWDWGAAFDLLRLPRPSAAALSERLKSSIRRSRALGYHEYDPDQEVPPRVFEHLLNGSGCQCAIGGRSTTALAAPGLPPPQIGVGAAQHLYVAAGGFRRGSASNGVKAAAASRGGLPLLTGSSAPSPAAEAQCVFANPSAVLPDILHQRPPKVLASQRAKVFKLHQRRRGSSDAANGCDSAAASPTPSASTFRHRSSVRESGRPPNSQQRQPRQRPQQPQQQQHGLSPPADAPSKPPEDDGWQTVSRRKKDPSKAFRGRGRGSYRRGGNR